MSTLPFKVLRLIEERRGIGLINEKEIKNVQDVAKELIFGDINRTAVALVHEIFRNGPVEDIHASPNSKLTDEDMKTINKYMVDHVACILNAIKNENWLSLYLLLARQFLYGRNWDRPEFASLPDGYSQLAAVKSTVNEVYGEKDVPVDDVEALLLLDKGLR